MHITAIANNIHSLMLPSSLVQFLKKLQSDDGASILNEWYEAISSNDLTKVQACLFSIELKIKSALFVNATEHSSRYFSYKALYRDLHMFIIENFQNGMLTSPKWKNNTLEIILTMADRTFAGSADVFSEI